MARRTFRQLKDNIDLKKGQLWQEECDDGDQDYRALDPVLWRFPDANYGSAKLKRPEVEEQPSWFVEVFEVVPQYATKEEIKKFKARKV